MGSTCQLAHLTNTKETILNALNAKLPCTVKHETLTSRLSLETNGTKYSRVDQVKFVEDDSL